MMSCLFNILCRFNNLTSTSFLYLLANEREKKTLPFQTVIELDGINRTHKQCSPFDRIEFIALEIVGAAELD